ncbi:unnamed protein product [Hymenolepis diminuta]|uniref:Uncharacterized protein n=1 Tax=Hymenolepis diminuta TaxID=6216 RepID=A0A564YG36_HYMDI|nr:unnamed protein product [Hymenolepis diminuta]
MPEEASPKKNTFMTKLKMKPGHSHDTKTEGEKHKEGKAEHTAGDSSKPAGQGAAHSGEKKCDKTKDESKKH